MPLLERENSRQIIPFWIITCLFIRRGQADAAQRTTRLYKMGTLIWQLTKKNFWIFPRWTCTKYFRRLQPKSKNLPCLQQGKFSAQRSRIVIRIGVCLRTPILILILQNLILARKHSKSLRTVLATSTATWSGRYQWTSSRATTVWVHPSTWWCPSWATSTTRAMKKTCLETSFTLRTRGPLSAKHRTAQLTCPRGRRRSITGI
jgi:hypothetical protein